MIFEEIVLHNFGIYKGHHIIKLVPSASHKSIILLGGLNGSGKTTLLDALQLTLYGKFAKYLNRSHVNYFEYLRRMINNHVEPKNGAALELQFKHYRDGKEEFIRIYRSWHSIGSNIKETLKVERDGILDPIITEHWYEYVEEFIPARISNLFFFDGEKIEAFADQDKAAELLKTGIHALLGLDLVDRLSIDLLTIMRKRKAQYQSQQISSNIKSVAEEIERLEQQVKKIAQQETEIQSSLKQSKQQQNQFLEEYRREGGEISEQRGTIEAQLTAAKDKLSHIEEQLRELAAGEAPLLMVRNFIRQAEQQALRETEAKRNRTLHEELKKHDATLLQLLKQHAANEAALAAVQAFIKQDKLKRQDSLEIDCYLNIEPMIFSLVSDRFLNQIQASITTLLEQAKQLTDDINGCKRKLASIPDPESLKDIKKKIQKVQQKIEQDQLRIEALETEQKRIYKEIARKQTDLTQAYEIETEEKFANETTNRVLKHAEKVQCTLKKFGQALTQKHLQQLESLILDSFQQLISKNQLINRIEIDPITYRLTLYTPAHDQLSPESLSAGERQLLTISILWGLSRASGRPLPAIIDTPLSRLDGKHRQNLVDNYFHQASHQVILLSTDEEINHNYYNKLKSMIGREYHIFYDEKEQSSMIVPGYFS